MVQLLLINLEIVRVVKLREWKSSIFDLLKSLKNYEEWNSPSKQYS